jgi:hypothetical protein
MVEGIKVFTVQLRDPVVLPFFTSEQVVFVDLEGSLPCLYEPVQPSWHRHTP